MKIKTGDILQVSGDKLTSKIIKKFTKSQWSHAGIFVWIWDELYVIEAEKRGIQITKWNDVKYQGGKTTSKKLKLLKPDLEYRINEEELARFVLPYCGTEPYDFIGLLSQAFFQITGIWWGKTKEAAEKRMYCSEFVAFVYNHFYNTLFKEWWLISPVAIGEEKGFSSELIN